MNDPKDEAENQDMLAHYDAVEVEVVRDADTGEVISAIATYDDGEVELLFHMSPASVRAKRVRASTSRRALP